MHLFISQTVVGQNNNFVACTPTLKVSGLILIQQLEEVKLD
jgi:hypothetical protein